MSVLVKVTVWSAAWPFIDGGEVFDGFVVIVGFDVDEVGGGIDTPIIE